MQTHRNIPADKSAPIRLKLTDIGIKDSIVEPFGVRVSAGGAKTFIVQGRIGGEKNPTRLKR
jgi:hypothetical protein